MFNICLKYAFSFKHINILITIKTELNCFNPTLYQWAKLIFLYIRCILFIVIRERILRSIDKNIVTWIVWKKLFTTTRWSVVMAVYSSKILFWILFFYDLEKQNSATKFFKDVWSKVKKKKNKLWDLKRKIFWLLYEQKYKNTLKHLKWVFG